jgi:hypothetical protein
VVPNGVAEAQLALTAATTALAKCTAASVAVGSDECLPLTNAVEAATTVYDAAVASAAAASSTPGVEKKGRMSGGAAAGIVMAGIVIIVLLLVWVGAVVARGQPGQGAGGGQPFDSREAGRPNAAYEEPQSHAPATPPVNPQARVLTLSGPGGGAE